jgi:hypothetical protein
MKEKTRDAVSVFVALGALILVSQLRCDHKPANPPAQRIQTNYDTNSVWKEGLRQEEIYTNSNKGK